MENDKIIPLTNLFQHLLSVEMYLNEKFYIFNEKFSNQCKEQAAKCLLIFSHYTRLHLEYSG